MKKILLSLISITAVLILVFGVSKTFFSDTETSTGNTFTAGAIDLKTDNKSYVTSKDGVIAESPDNTWDLDDLDGKNRLSFSFADLKPGDLGKNTISPHVNNNDAYACMGIKLAGAPENDANEAEVTADDSASDTQRELQNELNFAFWTETNQSRLGSTSVVHPE